MLHVLPAVMLALLVQQREQVAGSVRAPSPIPISWEIDFKFEDLRRMEVQLPGEDEPQIYWYLVYTATNTSVRTVRFVPTMQLVTEDLQVLKPDRGISKLVFDKIKALYATKYPYLVHPTPALGDLLTGDDNARESVAIWRQFDLKVNHFTLYVAGLSGETRFVRNPAYDPSKPETKKVVGPDGHEREVDVNPRNFALRKTLEIRYALPGSPQMRPLVEPKRLGVRWIMR